MINIKDASNWTLVPSTSQDIDIIREKCRRLVMRRAALSAAVSAIPLPLLDVAFDARLLATLIDQINTEFGLTSEQIQRVLPETKMFSFQAMAGVGSVLIGNLVTRQFVAQWLKQSGVKVIAKNSARIGPIAGQVVSAAIGFTTLRSLGYQHIDTCARIAVEIMMEKTQSA